MEACRNPRVERRLFNGPVRHRGKGGDMNAFVEERKASGRGDKPDGRPITPDRVSTVHNIGSGVDRYRWQ
jgi:hypothetical protein